MNFLLTGASGFIGRRLVKRLLSGGHFVSIFTRNVRERDDRNVGQFFWDMSGPAPAEPFRDVDAVIHLAGEPIAQRWTKDVKERIRRSRTLGTRHLVDAMSRLRKPPAVLVSGSAIGYYGDRGDEILKEESPPGVGFLPQICIEWEREADAAAAFGVRVVKIRTGIALGKAGGALKKMLPIFRFGLGGVLGSGRQWMSWIHIEDLVEMLVFAAENRDVRGAVNGCAPNAVQNAEFTQILAAALHRPAFFPVPAAGLQLLYGEMSQVVLEGQRAIPSAALATGFKFTHPSLDESLQDLLKS